MEATMPNGVDIAHIPARRAYVKLHKWPESEGEFSRSISHVRYGYGSSTPRLPSDAAAAPGAIFPSPRMVDCVSCRQMYLRSYKFSRKESVEEKTKKCLVKVKEKVNKASRKIKSKLDDLPSNGDYKVIISDFGKRKCVVILKATEDSCVALLSMFRKLFSCTTRIGVVGRT